MRRSTERILTTHTGSLPRPKDLRGLLQAREEGRLSAGGALHDRTRSAVFDTNIVWHKLRSLVEGARLASEALW